MNILQILVDGLSAGSIYILLALGLSLVFSVMGLINFAYGSLIVWAGYSAYVLTALGLPYPVMLAVATLTTVLLSVLIGRVVFLSLSGAPASTLLLASFGVALALQSLAVVTFGDVPRVVPTPAVMATSIDLGFVRISVLQVVALLLGALVLVALDILVNRTRFGFEMRAVAEDATTAALMGVRSNMVLLSVFALTGLIAAAVAFIWFAQVGTVSPRADFNPTLKAFVAVVLGGLGTIRGAVLGGLALGLLESSMASLLDNDWLAYQQSIAFIIIIILLILRPQGIAGKIVQVSK